MTNFGSISYESLLIRSSVCLFTNTSDPSRDSPGCSIPLPLNSSPVTLGVPGSSFRRFRSRHAFFMAKLHKWGLFCVKIVFCVVLEVFVCILCHFSGFSGHFGVIAVSLSASFWYFVGWMLQLVIRFLF